MDIPRPVQPPFIWPDAETLATAPQRIPPLPLGWISESLSHLSGLVSGVDLESVEWLWNALNRRPEMTCALLIALAPAGPTNRDVLNALSHLQELWPDRMNVKLCVVGRGMWSPSNVMLMGGAEDGEYYLVSGPSPNFGLYPVGTAQANLVVRADASLVTVWRNWFVWQWKSGSSLGPQTIDIPDLAPAEGDPQATRMWNEYVERLRRAGSNATAQPKSTDVNPETGEVVIKCNGEAVPSIADKTGLPALSHLRERISGLYAQGDLVSVDKFSRVRPLDCPIKPEWFGDHSRKIGTISRTVGYRISALKESLLRRLEATRKGLSGLLAVLGFSLGDGQRWIPHKAKKLLERELDRMNAEGKELLKSTLKGTPHAFVQDQRERIIADANRMYQNLYPGPGRELSGEVILDILRAVEERLVEANTGQFVPHITYTQVSAPPSYRSDLVSPWGQPLLLLSSIAQYSRKCFTDRFFFHNTKLTEDELADAMNICDDYIWSWRAERHVMQLANAELGLLKRVIEASADQRDKCQWIIDIMAGNAEAVSAAIHS